MPYRINQCAPPGAGAVSFLTAPFPGARRLLWVCSLVAALAAPRVWADVPAPQPTAPETSIEAQDGETPDLAFQVGAFLSQENAKALAEDLQAHGFYGEILEKTVGGRHYWAVIVRASANPFVDRRRDLLAAGFPSFPIRVKTGR